MIEGCSVSELFDLCTGYILFYIFIVFTKIPYNQHFDGNHMYIVFHNWKDLVPTNCIENAQQGCGTVGLQEPKQLLSSDEGLNDQGAKNAVFTSGEVDKIAQVNFILINSALYHWCGVTLSQALSGGVMLSEAFTSGFFFTWKKRHTASLAASVMYFNVILTLSGPVLYIYRITMLLSLVIFRFNEYSWI